MTELCPDIGYMSVNKHGEELCGDHVETSQVTGDTDSRVIVLADGLGSGVKANILSTLTSKIISTMMAGGMAVEDCVATIAATLPVCKEREVAYSTFTIIKIVRNERAEVIQYDNPHVILLRNGFFVPMEEVSVDIGGKMIYKSTVELCENDVFIAMSDGAIHAGIGSSLNFGWQRDEIIDYMQTMYDDIYTARELSQLLLGECMRLYGNLPGDDTTVCTLKMRRRTPVSVLIGPPASPSELTAMHEAFKAEQGKHIVAGGTTSTLYADFLHKPLVPSLEYTDPDIPPIAELDGVELVTEGVVTMSRVLKYAEDFLGDNVLYDRWITGRDGASMAARMLLCDATDVIFYVGRAVNPAHQNPELPISFNIKMRLIEELGKLLSQMGKNVTTYYY